MSKEIAVPQTARQMILEKRMMLLQAKRDYDLFIQGIASGLGLQGDYKFDPAKMIFIQQEKEEKEDSADA